jgi:cytochrome P450
MAHHDATQPPRFPFARMYAFDPPLFNSKLRSQDPVTQVQLYDGTKAWVVMEHKDICGALASEDLSADRRHPGYPEIHEGGHAAKEACPTLVNLDNPEHDQQRNMLQAAFETDAVAAASNDTECSGQQRREIALQRQRKSINRPHGALRQQGAYGDHLPHIGYP